MDLAFFRILSGKIAGEQQLVNLRTGKSARISGLILMQGKTQKPVHDASAELVSVEARLILPSVSGVMRKGCQDCDIVALSLEMLSQFLSESSLTRGFGSDDGYTFDHAGASSAREAVRWTILRCHSRKPIMHMPKKIA